MHREVQPMATDFFERCDAIEKCYEFMLAYAGQGLPTDHGSQSGGQVREFLQRAVRALTGLAESCSQATADSGLEPAAKHQAFISVLQRDAQDFAGGPRTGAGTTSHQLAID